MDERDLGLGVRVVGFDAGLTAAEAHCAIAARFDGHGQQRHGNLFAGRKQPVHFTGGRILGKRRSKAHQFIGGLAHGGHDSHDVIALLLDGDQTFRDHLNALGGRYRSASELRYQ